MRKVYTKGIVLAHKQLLLACTAYNLKKWMRFKDNNSIAQVMVTQAMECKAALVSIINWFTCCFFSYFMNSQQNRYRLNERLSVLYYV
jgi:hypothetical protein